MPTVDPSFTPPPPDEVVVSPDGVLSARVDAENAGVHLRADFSAQVPQPLMVRFYRGDGSPVRSGDVAYAPDGLAHAYDHEASPGEVNAYSAMPLDLDGVQSGDMSDSVGVTLPWSVSTSDVWLKNLADPSKSLHIRAHESEETARPAQTSFTRVPGMAVGPSSSSGPTGGLSLTLSVYVDDKATYQALLGTRANGYTDALLDGNVLLVQPHPDRGGFEAFYARPDGDVLAARRAHGFGYGMREVPITLTESRRPSTLGAPMIVPSVSWALVSQQYATWDELAATVPSWEALLGWVG